MNRTAEGKVLNVVADEWYWCLTHKAVESADSGCPPGERLGPYPSREAAEHWKEKVDQRNATWDAEDKADWKE